MIKETAEKLLERPLTQEDGINNEEIEAAEELLNLKIPEPLKDLYLNIGNLSCFMTAFERFLKPEELYLEKGKLIFIEENQEVCRWGIDPDEENPEVFMYIQLENDTEEEYHSENIKLSDFLNVMIYYQFTAGGYEYDGSICGQQETEDFIKNAICDWEKAVDNNGLVIYWQPGMLLWYFTDREGKIQDSTVLISSNSETKLQEMKKYGFKEF
ncbi:MAG: hypothetical protein LBU51_07625 [Bacteroidales bacterium]|jgi:hypothetical protein|nr:hypothetical protein [Bacteroidales bacterium]